MLYSPNLNSNSAIQRATAHHSTLNRYHQMSGQQFPISSQHMTNQSVPHGWSKEQDQLILRLKEEGHSHQYICDALQKEFGVKRNRNVVSKRIGKLCDESIEAPQRLHQAIQDVAPELNQLLFNKVMRIGDELGLGSTEKGSGPVAKAFHEAERMLLRVLIKNIQRLVLKVKMRASI
ncbi:hypothetical protein B0T22DRAFT_536337 [Podospora appendiculata]|uniref:Uncharacterized protein n=1 Tax=Podospora appendiculata TaxID=314037 RepID=A0AAE0XBH4_9PEZI|nr:hypothetical protein B0T22DRAFT_536337 [Podospora appendiculata]